MPTREKMVCTMLKNPEIKAENDALEPEFVLLDELLKARTEAGLTWEGAAKRMSASRAAIACIEAGRGRRRPSPSVTTLRKYAEAVGCKQEI